jgi:hypothetical protein
MGEGVNMDRSIVELVGRGRLIEELLRAGLEVALPARDRGIDLIVYADLSTQVSRFIARPIQMKAASAAHFSINKKYGRFPNLLLAFVWFVGEPAKTSIYVLTQKEAVQVGNQMGYTKTDSWRKHGSYSTQKPGRKLRLLLESYMMTRDKWWQKVTNRR